MKNKSTHALKRSSPKGGPFLGTCFKCGATNLPLSAVRKPCVNAADLTDDEALLHAICPPIGRETPHV